MNYKNNYQKKNNCCNYLPFIIPQGPPGPPGPATIEIGTVTTGEPGTDAEVVNSWNVFNRNNIS